MTWMIGVTLVLFMVIVVCVGLLLERHQQALDRLADRVHTLESQQPGVVGYSSFRRGVVIGSLGSVRRDVGGSLARGGVAASGTHLHGPVPLPTDTPGPAPAFHTSACSCPQCLLRWRGPLR